MRLLLSVAQVQASANTKFKLSFPLPEQFRGEVVRMETIAKDGIGDWVYAYRENVGEAWSGLHLKSRVVFHIAFTFGGANAFEVQLESPQQTDSR